MFHNDIEIALLKYFYKFSACESTQFFTKLTMFFKHQHLNLLYFKIVIANFVFKSAVKMLCLTLRKYTINSLLIPM